MFLRDFYKQRFNKTKNPEDWKFFQTFRNIMNVEKRKKKKTFYSDKLNELKNDMTSTWKLLNMAIGTKSKTTNINSFTIDGKEKLEIQRKLRINLINISVILLSEYRRRHLMEILKILTWTFSPI